MLFLDTTNTNQDKTYKLQQYALKDVQILDVLIQIAKTIDNLINEDQNFSCSDEVNLIRSRIRREKYHNLLLVDSSPHYLANLHLNSTNQRVLKKIYSIICKMVKNNRKNSEYIIKGDILYFLLSQLKSDETVQTILKESVYMSDDTKEIRLLQWMDLIEPLYKIQISSYYQDGVEITNIDGQF